MAPSESSSPVPAPTRTVPGALACGSQDFLPILKHRYDGTAPKLTIVDAKVRRCRNGYALVTAVADQSVCRPGKGFCYDNEQVLLRWSGGRWRILTSGTGLTCSQETDPDVQRACRGLGYPG